MIYLKNTKTYDFNNADELWFIVRSAGKCMDLIRNSKKCKWIPDLSPQSELFHKYLDLKQRNWNEQTFQSVFVPTFINNLKCNPKGLEYLKLLEQEGFNKHIELICFCDHEELCHRSIIGGILLNRHPDDGLIECNHEYVKYGVMFDGKYGGQ